MLKIARSPIVAYLVLMLSAQALCGSISVRIVDPDRKPIAAAVVKIAERHPKSFYANSRGEVEIKFKDEKALHRIYVSGPASRPTAFGEQKFDIPTGQGIVVELKLEKMQSQPPRIDRPRSISQGKYSGYSVRVCCCVPNYCCEPICCCCCRPVWCCCCAESTSLCSMVLCSAKQVSAGNAKLSISVPQEAVVSINGIATRSTGTHREYISRNLKPGYIYRYVVRAQISRSGKLVEQTKEVVLNGGESQNVVFDFSMPDKAPPVSAR